MSFFLFTPKVEQMLNNVTSVGPRHPIFENSGPRWPICFSLGALGPKPGPYLIISSEEPGPSMQKQTKPTQQQGLSYIYIYTVFEYQQLYTSPLPVPGGPQEHWGPSGGVR